MSRWGSLFACRSELVGSEGSDLTASAEPRADRSVPADAYPGLTLLRASLYAVPTPDEVAELAWTRAAAADATTAALASVRTDPAPAAGRHPRPGLPSSRPWPADRAPVTGTGGVPRAPAAPAVSSAPREQAGSVVALTEGRRSRCAGMTGYGAPWTAAPPAPAVCVRQPGECPGRMRRTRTGRCAPGPSRSPCG